MARLPRDQRLSAGGPAPRPPALVAADPASALADRALWAYMDDIVGRYQQRPATPAEVERALREAPSDDLAPPTGLLVVAVDGDAPIGCGGVRLLADGIAELTRVWVASTARRRGLATRIVAHLERNAASSGATQIRLDARADLVEARALYAHLGYEEVPAFNDHPYVNHWFQKPLQRSR